MTTGEKIKQTRIAQNMTMEEFAEKIGTTKQNIYKYENGIVTNIPLPKIQAMAKVLGVEPGWLAGFQKNTSYSYDKSTGLLTIPFISQKLSAGPGEDYLPEECMEVRTIDVLACMLRGVEDRSTLVCAEAKGDSMVGARIYSGDYVVFSRGLVNEEGIYVLSLCGDVLVKRLSFDKLDNKLSIISENPKYPVKTVDADDPNVRILGKVVGWIHAEPV